MDKRELTCIGCPMGCTLSVELENKEVKKVSGFTCPRGEQYAIKEVTNPTRIVTSTVRIKGGNLPAVSVKTSKDIPKDKIKECIAALKGITVTAPVHIGDIVLRNVAGTDSDIIITREIGLMV